VSAAPSDENPSKRLVYGALTLGTAFALLSVRIDDHTLSETHMNTLSSKLTAFAAALMVNGLVMGALGYLFVLQSHPNMSAIAFARAVVSHQWLS
jgi:hypothetical protein